MKNNILLLGISLIFLLPFISCNKEKTKEPIGELINHSNCKDFYLKSNVQIDNYGSDTSCVTYSYNSVDKKLTFKHINAGFNCCPENLFCEITLINDTIRIKEIEENEGCNCCCLFDLDINVSAIESEKYYIVFEEPYCGNQQKIIFEIDLPINTSGEFFVQRTEYPWGI